MKAGPLSSDSLSSGDDITVAAKFAKRPGIVIVEQVIDTALSDHHQ